VFWGKLRAVGAERGPVRELPREEAADHRLLDESVEAWRGSDRRVLGPPHPLETDCACFILAGEAKTAFKAEIRHLGEPSRLSWSGLV
jgi:hypothetical protein